jgi:hypothetical protein
VRTRRLGQQLRTVALWQYWTSTTLALDDAAAEGTIALAVNDAAKDNTTLALDDVAIKDSSLALDDTAKDNTTLAVDDAVTKDSSLALDNADSFYSIDVEVNVSGGNEVLDITSEAEWSVDDGTINVQKSDISPS